MVSPLGSLPIASPLQNPVLTGYGNLFSAMYAPLQQMVGPLSSLAYAEMLSGRGNMYNTRAQLNTAQVQAGVPEATAYRDVQSGNLAGAKTGLVPTEQTLMQARTGVANAQAGKVAQQGINIGAPGTVNPYTVSPGGIPVSQGAVQSTSPTMVPQQNNLAPVAPTVLTPQQQSQMNSLQGQLQPTVNALQQGQIQPSGQFDMSQVNNPDYYDQYFTQNPNAAPPQWQSQGAVENPTVFIKTKVQAAPQFLDGVDSIMKYTNNPIDDPYNGNSASAIAMRAQGAALAKLGKAPQGYIDHQIMLQNLTNTAEGGSKALTGSLGVTPMKWIRDTLNPDNYANTASYTQAVNGLVGKLHQDMLGIVNQNYMPGFKNQAFNSLKSIVNSDTYQSYLKSKQAPVGEQQFQLQPSYTYNGKTYSAAQIQQAAQQGGISPQVLVQRMQRMGGG